MRNLKIIVLVLSSLSHGLVGQKKKPPSLIETQKYLKSLGKEYTLFKEIKSLKKASPYGYTSDRRGLSPLKSLEMTERASPYGYTSDRRGCERLTKGSARVLYFSLKRNKI